MCVCECVGWLHTPWSCAEKVQLQPLPKLPANTSCNEAAGTARPWPRCPPSAGVVALLCCCPPPVAPLPARANCGLTAYSFSVADLIQVKGYACFLVLDSRSFFLSPHGWFVVAPELHQLQSSLHVPPRLGYILWAPKALQARGASGEPKRSYLMNSWVESRGLSHTSPICRGALPPSAGQTLPTAS